MHFFYSTVVLISLSLLASVSQALPCEDDIPDFTFNSLHSSFAMLIQSSDPALHGRFVSFTPSGGTDQSLYLSNPGTPVTNFTLTTGLWKYGSLIKAVVSTQWDSSDGTTKIFFTDRTQQNAVLGARLACNPDTKDLQTVFHLTDGASICVRPESGKRYGIRYKPAGAVGQYPSDTSCR